MTFLNFPLITFLAIISAYSSITCSDQNKFSLEDQNIPNYIIQLKYAINEAAIPRYIINQFLYNSDSHISSKAFISIFGLQNATMEEYSSIFAKLDLSLTNAFSIDVLGEFFNATGLEFRAFYDKLLEGLEKRHTSSERNALKVLSISTGDFADAMEYRSSEEAFKVFRLGDFSKECLENATVLLGTSLEDIFFYVNNILLDHLMNLTKEILVSVINNTPLIQYNLDYLIDIFNISVLDVTTVDNLNRHLTDLKRPINYTMTLGVATDKNIITANKVIYDVIYSQQNVLKIIGKPLGEMTFNYEILHVFPTGNSNVIQLNVNSSMPSYILIPENQTAPLVNCSYITLYKTDIIAVITVNAAELLRENGTITLKANLTDVVIGSPLICMDRLYGLANGTNLTHITFISVYGRAPSGNSSGPLGDGHSNQDFKGASFIHNADLIMVFIVFYIGFYLK